ncbi:facilitated glucose transporter protein 1-like [Watersipora subatra]|uniref:facilitated glucose transporter protein 1-like n=1 Tax=Watersipora subatra TaxID=2589382 RepID=UPI00355C668B
MSEKAEKDPLLGNVANPMANMESASAYPVVGVGDEVINRSYETPVCGKWMYFSVLASVIGTSFSYGYALGSLNTPTKVMQGAYKNWYNISSGGGDLSQSEITFLWSATVSIYCLGGVLSGCVSGFMADKFGRKRCMLVLNIVQVIAVALMFSSIWLHSYGVIIAGRFIYGLYGGFATVVCPLYLNEISPESMRGSVGSMNQMGVVVGLLLGQVIGLPQILGSPDYFYYILAIPIIPAVLHWAMLAVSPESPTWLYLKGNDREGARAALEKLRDMSVMTSVDGELEDYHRLELSAASEPQVSLKDMFTTYRWRPLAVASVMHASQQLGGINAVIFYSTIIFLGAGLTHDAAQYATLSLGGINIIMTLVSLVLVERLGRRTLHLYGMGGGFISLALLSTFLLFQALPGVEWMSYLCIIFVATYLIFWAVGPANIPWIYTAELFDMASRKWAISIAIAVNWSCNFLVGVSFPSIQLAMQNYAFLPFMAIIAICWTFLYSRALETKGRSALSITSHYKTVENISTLPVEERRHYRTFATT